MTMLLLTVQGGFGKISDVDVDAGEIVVRSISGNITVPSTWEREGYGTPLYVNIKYLDDRLILINLSSPSYPPERIETSLKDWGRFALKVLLSQYGEPDNTVEPVENVGLSSFSTGYEAPLYEWNRGKERIVLYLSEYASTYGCGVILEDVEEYKKTME